MRGGKGRGVVFPSLQLRTLQLSTPTQEKVAAGESPEDPIPQTDAGDIARMTEAWVRWGRDKGYSS